MSRKEKHNKLALDSAEDMKNTQLDTNIPVNR